MIAPTSDQAPSQIERWSEDLGMMPVPMLPGLHDSFVLLNGGQGNFCISSDRERWTETAREAAWSADVPAFVTVAADVVEVQFWNAPEHHLHRFKTSTVLPHLSTFHQRVLNRRSHAEQSVIAHAIGIFRSLRRALEPEVTTLEALRAFLYLLVAADDKEATPANDPRVVALGSPFEYIPSLIENWETLREALQNGRPERRLKADLKLLMRHACGQLFQESHYELLLPADDQLILPSLLPLPPSVTQQAKEVGIHYTPPALVRTLVEETLRAISHLPHHDLTIFDPACGSGEFLRESLRQLVLNGYPGSIALIGWDKSPSACLMARFALAWEATSIGKSPSIRIEQRDSLLEAEWPRGADVIIMNPPFLAWPDMTDHTRETVTKVLGPLRTGRADLAAAFLMRAVRSANEETVLSCVLPASILETRSSSKLRDELGNSFGAHLIARLGSHDLFSRAIVDTALYVGTPRAKGPHTAIAVCADHRPDSSASSLRALRKARHLGPLALPVEEDGYSIYPNHLLGKGTGSWSPRPLRSWRLKQRLREFPSLGSQFHIHQGVRTGNKKVFVLSEIELEALPKSERSFFRPAVVNLSITEGRILQSYYVFYPYGDCVLDDEDEVALRLPHYWSQYLVPNRDQLRSRRHTDPQDWWRLARPRSWQMDQRPKVVSTYFGGRGSFAWDEVGSFVVVQGWAWLPRGNRHLSSMVGNALVALLNGKIFETLVSSVSNHVGGGQWDLSSKYLVTLPFPDLWSTGIQPEILERLEQIGNRLKHGLAVDEHEWLQCEEAAFMVTLDN